MEMREKVQSFRELLVRLTLRLGQSTRGSIVQQVNYRYVSSRHMCKLDFWCKRHCHSCCCIIEVPNEALAAVTPASYRLLV